MENQLQSKSSAAVLFPQLDRLLPHQREVIFNHNQRFKVLVWHRRARKTTTAITELVRQAHRRVGVYWHIFPTYNEAFNSVWLDPAMLFNIIPEELIDHKNESNLIVFFKNGSILQLKGADKPERLLGAGPYGVVLDEFAEMKYDTWQRVVQPIVTANQGWCWFVGTPRGKNHLYEVFQRGQLEDKEWKSWKLKATESGIIPSEDLANSKITMPQSLFNQEWECEFLEGEGSVFRGVSACMVAQPQRPFPEHSYVMGLDLAKVQDYTVITVYDRKTNSQVYQDRFKTMEWPFQKAKIRETAIHYNNALAIIDATGLGDPIADDLARSGIAVEPIKFTNESKKELVEKLSIWIDQGKIRMLPIEETSYEFDNFGYEIGIQGRIRYGAREGFHDDIVWSHALAIWGLAPLPVYQRPIIKPLIRQVYEQQIAENITDPEVQEWAEWEANN